MGALRNRRGQTERVNMRIPNLEQMKRFVESNLPDLDVVLLAACRWSAFKTKHP
jgi:hypothetical protein